MSEIYPWHVELKNGSNTRVDDVAGVAAEAGEDVFQLDDAHGIAFIAPLSSISYAKRLDLDGLAASPARPALNRYIIAGVVSDASDGRTVVIVSRSRSVDGVFKALLEAASTQTRSVAANGRQRIDFKGGGSIHFTTPDSSLIGFPVDVVYVCDWNSITEGQRDLIKQMAPNGELIRR